MVDGFVSKIIGFKPETRGPWDLSLRIRTHSTGKSAYSLPSALGLWSLCDLIGGFIEKGSDPLPYCTIRSRLGGAAQKLYITTPFTPTWQGFDSPFPPFPLRFLFFFYFSFQD